MKDMRWYEKQLDIKDMPSSDSAMVVGLIEDDKLKINVEYFRDGELFVATVWAKPLKTRRDNELIHEDIQDTHWDKLTKIRNNHEMRKYDEWLTYFAALADKETSKRVLRI